MTASEVRLLNAVETFEGNGLHAAMHYRQLPKRSSLTVQREAFARDLRWYRIHTEDVFQKAERVLWE